MESMKKPPESISELARLQNTRSVNKSQFYFCVLEIKKSEINIFGIYNS